MSYNILYLCHKKSYDKIQNYIKQNRTCKFTSDKITEYKEFLTVELLNDEENFRITRTDDLTARFPTKDKEDSFTLGAYIDNQLAGIVSFRGDEQRQRKKSNKNII
jgi:hypothetical protein